MDLYGVNSSKHQRYGSNGTSSAGYDNQGLSTRYESRNSGGSSSVYSAGRPVTRQTPTYNAWQTVRGGFGRAYDAFSVGSKVVGQYFDRGLERVKVGFLKSADRQLQEIDRTSGMLLDGIADIGHWAAQSGVKVEDFVASSVSAVGMGNDVKDAIDKMRIRELAEPANSVIGKTLGAVGNAVGKIGGIIDAASGVTDMANALYEDRAVGDNSYRRTMRSMANTVGRLSSGVVAGVSAGTGAFLATSAVIAKTGLGAAVAGSAMGGAAIVSAPVVIGVAAGTAVGLAAGYAYGKIVQYF